MGKARRWLCPSPVQSWRFALRPGLACAARFTARKLPSAIQEFRRFVRMRRRPVKQSPSMVGGLRRRRRVRIERVREWLKKFARKDGAAWVSDVHESREDTARAESTERGNNLTATSMQPPRPSRTPCPPVIKATRQSTGRMNGIRFLRDNRVRGCRNPCREFLLSYP
jgi:hypothetical protein